MAKPTSWISINRFLPVCPLILTQVTDGITLGIIPTETPIITAAGIVLGITDGMILGTTVGMIRGITADGTDIIPDTTAMEVGTDVRIITAAGTEDIIIPAEVIIIPAVVIKTITATVAEVTLLIVGIHQPQAIILLEEILPAQM